MSDVDVIDRIEASRAPELMTLYATTWWTARRTRSDVEAMLARSGVVVGLVDRESARLVAFARAITDETYLAVVLDVIPFVWYAS